MEIKYKYIHFEKVAETPKTTSWICRTNRNNDDLGMVKWYSPWRQYCYFSAGGAVYNTGCLDDIRDFIQQLKQERLDATTDAG